MSRSIAGNCTCSSLVRSYRLVRMNRDAGRTRIVDRVDRDVSPGEEVEIKIEAGGNLFVWTAMKPYQPGSGSLRGEIQKVGHPASVLYRYRVRLTRPIFNRQQWRPPVLVDPI